MAAVAKRPRWARAFFYAPPPEGVTERHWAVIGILGVTYIANNYDIGLLNLALAQIQAGLGVAEEDVGAMAGTVRLGVLPALALTMLADRVGRRRLLLATILGFTACTVATAFAQTAAQFVVLQTLARMFMYAEEMLAIVVVAEELGASARGWGIGMLAALGACGHGLSAIVFGFIDVVPYGWRALYLIGGLPLLLVAWFRRNLEETRRFEEHREQREASGIDTGWLGPLRDLATMYPGRMLALAGALLPVAFTMLPAIQFQSKFLQESRGYTPAAVSTLVLLGGVLAIAGAAAGGRLSDRFGRRRTLCTVLLANLTAALLFYNGPALIVPGVWILMVFTYFSAEVLFGALGSELFPTSYRSTASGVRAIVGSLGAAAGLWVEGRLFVIAGSHATALSWMMVFALLTPPLILWLLPETAARELEEIAPERR